ncbi:DUF262 domain-containing protein [Paraburkholderia terrae]|uniref:DUF262 domain-containing protein n=1 Tax=Paraburkholderia terrae TaxID=311230 RepID=UPI002061E32F|nr:DUF262 domain-containing protein [Paraburkholderia terrae]BDC46143.1 hypothetical protein PTKU15_94400 [Paraburkholderia terrae]
MSVLDDVSRYRHEIATDSYTTTWREIIGQYKDGDLKIDPEYQRLFRWDVDQQTQYVESLLLNIPSPPLFLAANQDGGFEVIDGLQRLSTMIRFFAAEVFDGNAPAVAHLSDEPDNNITVPLTLAEGPIIGSLSGFTAQTLPEALIRTIRYARITIILLEKESSPTARYEVFKRLNKQGAILSDQEIRNCTARLFGVEFPTALREMGESVTIRSALQMSGEDERRMRVEEMILRLLAFNHSQTAPRHEVSEFLDEFMIFASEGKFRLTPEVRNRIEKTFEMIGTAFPDGKAFRFPRSGFSTNLFDIVATGVYANLDNLDVEEFKKRHAQLLKSSQVSEVTGAGSNTRKKMIGRIELGMTWFAR